MPWEGTRVQGTSMQGSHHAVGGNKSVGNKYVR
jgi:hypothetical protein